MVSRPAFNGLLRLGTYQAYEAVVTSDPSHSQSTGRLLVRWYKYHELSEVK